MRIIHIYCLLDPTNDEPFYVGATMQEPEKRLNSHVCDATAKSAYSSYHKVRGKRIREIVSLGRLPKILVIDSVHMEKAKEKEREYYNIISKLGYNLLQSPHHFQYGKNGMVAKNMYRHLPNHPVNIKSSKVWWR